MLETRRLHSSAPCRLPDGTAAGAAPRYYPLFLGHHRDGESHPLGSLDGRVTKVTLAPPTRPRPVSSVGTGPLDLRRLPLLFSRGPQAAKAALCSPGCPRIGASMASGKTAP